MEVSELLKERRQLFDNAIAFQHNKRVPLFANYFTWKVFDAGFTLDEATHDYGVMEKVVRTFMERYQFDGYNDIGMRNALRISAAVGGGTHKIDPTGEYIEASDLTMMLREEYPELNAGLRAGNTDSFYWSKLLPRVCREGVTVGEVMNGIREMLAYQEFCGRITNICNNEYGMLNIYLGSSCMLMPFENLFNTLRGIKNTAMDIRKCKVELKEYIDATWAAQYPAIEQEMKQPGCPTYITDNQVVMLGHSVLNTKQFEELYWPYLKKTIDCAHENGKTFFMFCEASILRFAEFLEEIPKGTVLIHLEQDDVFEFRKRLPDLAIAGGMPADLLGNGTKEQCIDYAKKLVDELGDGYVFSTDKMMSYRKDARGENVLAVNEFLRNYSL